MMIELEIQGLSERREGLLVEVGRLVLAGGFSLHRQRLVQDNHGILLTMVVQGPSRKQRALEAALDACERLISVKMFPFVEGETRGHFAASREPMEPVRVAPPVAHRPAAVAPAAKKTPVAAPVPAPAPAMADRAGKAGVVAAPVALTDAAARLEPIRTSALGPAPTPAPAPIVAEEPAFEFILPTPKAPTPPRAAAAPFIQLVPLPADEAAVERALHELPSEYPRIVPRLLALAQAVADGARESSLTLAGQRTGAWLFEREYALDVGQDLRAAIEHIGAPALRALVEVDQQDDQLRIHASPLCTEGHSGCAFFSGFLEGLLGPAIAPGSLSIFSVCCRSYGADDCVLAISD
ncbi:hypothetical protein RHOFW104T7_01015 [Rhodanobacter thiooxydans]|uniref:4-vinyl reductase 4VR domain-containing protein n=1 Tax=Rhodanobacter thiooxydans TaxID=416169 RepID=A0A154QDP1_9GAMM|nr:hypothetical protein [Rhodanobacter thiooxydans]EIL99565.1 WD repeat-containing protein [Rhodanobacter thiooxydans LCS2]KZC22376.1 hypothetical protein RHOFW104T7_01015 [Rhodanobacter thiooxydans]MCW0202830.1 hypothetical protein [Rhodanobacter thiooxydans]